MVLAAVRNTGANISDSVTKYSSTLDVPSYIPDTNEYIDRELYLYVITYPENKYMYVDNRQTINSGTTRIIIRDKDGEFVDLYSQEDQLQMVVDDGDVLNDKSYWTDIVNDTTNDDFALNATFYNNMDGALMNVDIKSIAPCNVTGFNASAESDQDLLLELQLEAGSKITTLKQPSNLKISYRNQSLRIVFLPPDIGDMASLDMFFKCEECMYGQMSFLIVLSNKVTSNDLNIAIAFVRGMISLLDLDFTLHVFGTSMQTVFTFDDHVNSSSEVSTHYQSAGISTTGVDDANLDWALNSMRSYLLNYANWSKRQYVVLLTDGNFNVNDKMDNVNVEVDGLRNLHVSIIGVEYGAHSESIFNIHTVVNSAPEWHVYTLGRNASIAIPTSSLVQLMGSVCYGNLSTRVYNKMRFGRVSALVLDDITNRWERSKDIKMKDISMDTATVTFQSNFLGTFGSNVFIVPPDLINFDELFVDFADKVADTPYVLAVNITCLVVLVLLIVILRRYDKKDCIAWDYQPLTDNASSDKYSYFLSFYTGFWSSRQLSSTPYVILKGSRGATSIRLLSDMKRGMFPRWTLRNFLLTTSRNLGTLCQIEIGYEGNGDSPGWFLEKLLVYDSFNNEKNIFLCGKWLSPVRGDRKTSRKLCTARSELTEGSVLFGSNTRFNLFDDFLFLSLFSRPSQSRFTRVQRCVSIFAMLFLSMLANAMWYRTSNGVQTYGIHLGPFHLNYKQIYVGLMSSVITIIPGFLMAWTFRNRRRKTELITTKIVNDGYLPWWSVIVGYVVAVMCIIAGATFTFFYSLQWGPETTVDWLMSFSMGTLQGVMFLEPLKVVFLTLMIAFLCKKYAKRDMEEMATVQMKSHAIDYSIDDQSGEKNNLKNINNDQFTADQLLMDITDRKRQERLHRNILLDGKLLTLFRSLWIKSCYILVLAIICAHNSVWTSFLQNRALENLLSPTQKINSTADIWTWLRGKYADRVFPKLYYNGDFRLTTERQYMFDDISYRIGVTRIRQVRVKGRCHIPGLLNPLIPICPPSYTRDTMDMANYCTGWIKRNDKKCKETEWIYRTDDETNAFQIAGLHHVYNGGGYVKILDPGPNTTDVRNDLYSMQANNWIDTFSRLVVIESLLFNPDSQLFSLPKITIEKPETGGYYTEIKVRTARLYPYIDVFDFFVLGLQVIFLIVTFGRFLHFFYTSWKLGKHCCTTTAQWVYLLSVVTSLACIVFYIVRIDRTIYTIEEIQNSTGKFVSLDLLDLMDTAYKMCISLELFIAVIDLLTPLTFNQSLYLMRTSISFCGKDLVYLGIASMIPMTAFAILCYCYIGPHRAEFKDIGSSYITLFRTLLAMVKVQDTFDADDILSGLIFSMFLLLMTIITVNLCICILNAALSHVKDNCLESTEFKAYDKDLQKHFWRKINNTFKMFQQQKRDNTDKLDTVSDTTRIWEMGIKLDNQIFKILGHLEQAFEDEAEDLEAYTKLHQITTKTD
ncbi:polycystic kidney disease protein 1-like 2 [Pecten maximus]|uniref:polycystic kidney disease protein 1-like 2 n=1 Tax=Pecten maximus TaxID=6579 RepID=UPI00145887DF|nr:polycystic kidney disease protein 1-like 2 [Pecten maximus]